MPSNSRVRLIGFVAILVMLLNIYTGHTQVLGERIGPQIPHLSTNARSMALGDASVALLDSRAESHANPGAIAAFGISSAAYTFNRISPFASLQHLGVTLAVGKSEAISLEADILHYGEFDFYTRQELRARGFEFSGAFAYAWSVADDLFAGIQARIWNSTTDSDPVTAGSASIGIAYAPGKYYRFGFSLHGLGSDYAVRNPVIQEDVYSPRIPKSAILGVVLDYPVGRGGDKLVASYQNDKLIGQRGIVYRMGLEYQLEGIAGVRVGAVVRGREFEPRAGFGITTGTIALDYAYQYSRRDGRPSHVTTMLVFW